MSAVAHAESLSSVLCLDGLQDVNTTSLQVSHTGRVPYPAVVGRDDVAALAVAAVMFCAQNDDGDSDEELEGQEESPFHYKLACRWVGQELAPFPPQGRSNDGAADAEMALRATLRTIRKNERRQRVLEQRRETRPDNGSSLLDGVLIRRNSPRLKPHGVCVAVTVYMMLGLFARALLEALVPMLPGGQTVLLPILMQMKRWTWVTASSILGTMVSYLPFLARRKQYIMF